MERIRKTSPYALALFAVIFIGFMVISDADFSSMMSKGKNMQTAVIVTINGDDILYKDFNALVQERIEQMRTNSQDEEQQIDEKQIRTDIWNEMIDKTLLNQEAERAGIYVSNAEILDIMIDNPPDFLRRTFPDSAGNFNRTAYLDIITNPNNLANYLPSSYSPEQIQEQIFKFKKDIVNVETYLKEQKLSESMTFLVSTSESILSPDFVNERYTAENSTVSADFIFFDVNSIKNEDIKVTDKELMDYYNDNKKYYEQKPMRRVKYVRFPIQPSYDDTVRAIKRITKIEEDLQLATTTEQRDSVFDVKLSEFGGNTSDYIMSADLEPAKAPYLDSMKAMQVIGPISMGPDGAYFFRLDDRRSGENEMVKASHILVKFNDNKDSAKAEAVKILNRAKKGEDFAKMAIELSEDKGSAEKGGDLGFFGKGRMIKEFEEAAFAAKAGEVVGPVETQFGYHIIKVIDKKSEEIKYSEINIKPTISTSTTNKLFREAFSIQRQVEEGTSFDNLIKKLNLVASMSNFVTSQQPILGSNYLTYLAFENSVGTVFEPMELDQYGIVVVQVTDAKQGGVKEFEEVKAQLQSELVHKKKLDALEKIANAQYSKIKDAQHLRQAASFDPSIQIRTVEAFKIDENIPGIGIDYGFAAEVFRQSVGKISKPIRGGRGYYIIEPYNRTLANTKNMAEIYSYKTQLQRDLRKRAFYTWFGKLKEDAIIEDFRHEFYRDY
ncbi:MAG: peptidylprolyl isomerase [bacterium]